MIGQILGHYRVLEKIGGGGMGVVYRAHDERLNRDVALKVLPAGALADDAARRRFRKEALVLAKLTHPNIAMIFDFDTQDSVDFLVMEYVAGQSLAQKLNEGVMSEKDAVVLGAQVAAALEEAHEQGVIHRDLNPRNILLTPKGQAKVLDFGLAKLLQPPGSTEATQSFAETGGVAGTLPYMAPEQLRGEALDGRTDIYALGCVFYQMAAGRRPFTGDTAPQLTDEILHQALLSLRIVNARVSPQFDTIILKCLEKEPENRYQSAKELAVDLRRLAPVPTVAALASSHPTVWPKVMLSVA
jgi:serine/threonine protein kinase